MQVVGNEIRDGDKILGRARSHAEAVRAAQDRLKPQNEATRVAIASAQRLVDVDWKGVPVRRRGTFGVASHANRYIFFFDGEERVLGESEFQDFIEEAEPGLYRWKPTHEAMEIGERFLLMGVTYPAGSVLLRRLGETAPAEALSKEEFRAAWEPVETKAKK